MSSASTGLYKSRLFNFLHRHSHRLREQGEVAVRHVKVGAVWGVQILLYPVYLLTQTARFAGHQLQQVAEQGWLELDESKQSPQTPVTSDTPIQRVLDAVNGSPFVATDSDLVNNIEVTEKISNPSATNTFSWQLTLKAVLNKLNPSQLALKSPVVKPVTDSFAKAGSMGNSPITNYKIQGIASLISSRTPVLITYQNQTLDILTPEQQQKLSFRISWEVADYWRQRKLMQVSEQRFTFRLLSAVNQPRLFPAVRLFWEVIAWVQTGHVAIAANLFQESALVKSQETKVAELEATLFSTFIIAPASFIVQRLSFLDDAIANLEKPGLAPKTELTIAIVNRTQATIQQFQESIGKQVEKWSSSQLTVSSDAATTDVRIQNLIRGAVDYFFGRRISKLPSTGYPQLTTIAANAEEKLSLSGDSTILNQPLRLSFWRSTGTLQKVAEVETRQIRQYPSLGKLKKVVKELITLENQQEVSENDRIQANTFKVQSLIKAAIHYFFGDRGMKLPSELNHYKSKKEIKRSPHQFTTLTSNQNLNLEQIKINEPDPWLTLSDLFGSKDATNSAIASEVNSLSKTFSVSRDVRVDDLPEKQINPDLSQGRIRKSTLSTPIAAISDAIVSPTNSDNLDYAPDWIETKATPIGYVKHPLEQLLEWLDRAMLWLEEMVVKFWRWLLRLP